MKGVRDEWREAGVFHGMNVSVFVDVDKEAAHTQTLEHRGHGGITDRTRAHLETQNWATVPFRVHTFW